MKKLISINPTNYKKLGEVEVSTKKEIKDKVKKAKDSQSGWGNLSVSDRVRYLTKVFDALKKHKEELGDLATKEMGMPKSMRDLIDVDAGLEYFHWYLENAEKYLSSEVTSKDESMTHTVYYESTGVSAVIVPWNFPVCNFVWGVIPNLLAGNAVVFKHSEECPLSGKRIEELIKTCGLPDGVFNEVYGGGDVGDYLVHQDIDMICFTGSTKIGKYLYKVAAEKMIKIVLELGGSAPGIVFEDADLSTVVESVFFNRFVNSGQICDGLKRLIVHKNRFNEVVSKLKELLESKKVGDPSDQSTDLGPLVAKRQLILLEDQVADALKKGAKVVTGGRSPQTNFYQPTILTNIKSSMRVWNEEVFGPVLPVVSFQTEEEAIKLANDTKYGLGGYVFTKDLRRAQKVASQIKTGMVAINSGMYLFPFNPFGGVKESGLGREHGKYGLHDLCQIKVITTA